MKSNIVLCGFMGSGKSTVGKIVAEMLGFDFVDSDIVIEQQEGKSITEIFNFYKEEYFRKVESEVIKELAHKEKTVIATGGGTVIDSFNAEILKQDGLLVFIDIGYETVINRLHNDTARPLLQRPDREEAIKELMSERYPVYRSVCDLIVDGNQNAEIVAETLVTEFKKLSEI